MIAPKFSALKTEDCFFKILNEDVFKKYLSRLPEQLEIIVRPLKRCRSNPQNRYLWGVVIEIIADHTGYSPEEVHDILKNEFLGEWVTVRAKDGGEKEIRVIRSTASLKTNEFEQYLEKCRNFASQTWGLYIPLPNEVDY